MKKISVLKTFQLLYKNIIVPATADLRTYILDVFFPITCICCDQGGLFICKDCELKLQAVPFQKCIACRKPSPFGMTHTGCISPYMADGLISFFDYKDKTVSKVIINGKYKFLPGAFTELSEIACKKLPISIYEQFKNSSLVPIPLSKNRLRFRGFNQSDIICSVFSKNLQLPILHALQRIKNTKTQKDLKRDERLKNIANAFSLSPQIHNVQPARLADGSVINHCNFIIVDDVTTTGSTLLEAVKVLKRNGAHKVWCLTLAQD